MAVVLETASDPYYSFPAIRGVQAGREYYSTMCALKLIPKIFSFDEDDVVPAELRAQRILNKGRVPAITKYMVENPNDYVFSSITASIDGEVEFLPTQGNGIGNRTGELRIPMASRIIINDGQHRRAAIEGALHEKPELGSDTISVVFFIDSGLKRSQQMFADLNQHAVRPTKSLGILYDHRDPFSRFNIRLIDRVPIFKDRVEVEKISISNRSLKFFTLSAIYQANRALLGKFKSYEKITDEEEALAIDFWTEVSSHIPEWKLLIQRKVSPYELRRDYVHAHGIAVHALGIAGHELLANHPNDWKKVLKKLESLDWSRSNAKIWEGRAMVGGMINKSRTSLVLTANLIKQILELPLNKEERKMEAFNKAGIKEKR